MVIQNIHQLWNLCVPVLLLSSSITDGFVFDELINSVVTKRHFFRHHGEPKEPFFRFGHHHQHRCHRHFRNDPRTPVSLPYKIDSTVDAGSSYILADDVRVKNGTHSSLPTTKKSTITAMLTNIKCNLKLNKKKIAKLGIDFGLSYNLISNINGSVTFSVAWFLASTKTGLSPLAPGQWKTLLTAYGSLYVFVCFLRPIRFALALGTTQRMGHFLRYIQDRIGITRHIAIIFTGALIFLLWGSFTILGVTIASWISAVPI